MIQYAVLCTILVRQVLSSSAKALSGRVCVFLLVCVYTPGGWVEKVRYLSLYGARSLKVPVLRRRRSSENTIAFVEGRERAQLRQGDKGRDCEQQ
jgi:hypothetical protein